MESTPSLVNWKPYNKLKAPGLDTLSSLQAVAHGSDSVQYFQWRKSRGSSEKFHGAVVGHDGTADTRVFRSVQRTGQVLQTIDEVCGTLTEAKAAVLFDWENWWALDDAQGYAKDDKKYLDTCYSYHREFWKRGIDCDIVSPLADLSRYKIAVAPMLYLVDEARAGNLRRFVENGGTLYGTYALSTVDGNDLCHLGAIPGLGLVEVFGLEAEEIDTLYPHERCSAALDGQAHELVDYCEVLKLKGAAPLAVYSEGWYEGAPAVTEHSFGAGKAVYQACRDTGSLKDKVFGKLLQELELTGPLEGDIPHSVTAQTRTDGENTYVFLQNYSPAPSGAVTLRQPMTDLITGETVKETALEPYGFRILKTKE